MAEWEFNHSIINDSGVGPAIHDTLLYGFMNLEHRNEKVVDIFLFFFLHGTISQRSGLGGGVCFD